MCSRWCTLRYCRILTGRHRLKLLALLRILEAVAEGVQEESLLPDCLGAKCDVTHGSADGEVWVVDRAADPTRLVAFALRDPVRWSDASESRRHVARRRTTIPDRQRIDTWLRPEKNPKRGIV